MIKLNVAVREQMKKAQEAQIATALASNMISGINNGTVGNTPSGGAPAVPQAFQGLPNANIPVPTGVQGVNAAPQDVVIPQGGK